jgi:hypothetical protein
MPAGADQGHNNMIANIQTMHVISNRSDTARGLVPINRRQEPTPVPIGKGNIRMANRDGTQCDLDFFIFRCAQVDILDMQGFAKFVAYGSFDAGHLMSSLIFRQFGTDRRRRKPEIVINGR